MPDGWLTSGREGVDIGPDGQPTGVLAEDPRRLPPARIADIEERATVVGGILAYGALPGVRDG